MTAGAGWMSTSSAAVTRISRSKPGGGALIADVLCEHRMPMILSVKHLSGRERSAFMVKFAQTLFQKWGGGPLHVVLEEAHELAPQMAGRAR
jgi:hypothetical protein